MKTQTRKEILMEDSDFLLKNGEWPGNIPKRVGSTADILEMVWREAGNLPYANIFAKHRASYRKAAINSKK